MSSREMTIKQQLRERLSGLRERHLYRQLTESSSAIDLCSNDYLGLARDFPKSQHWQSRNSSRQGWRGATGSRLVSGDSSYYRQVEDQISEFHGAETALIFSSGYLANLSLIATLASRHITILYDELIHASLRDGIRLSYAKAYPFRHNDCAALREKLQRLPGPHLIVIESLYSMDGDRAPLAEIVALAEVEGAEVVVDEAHSVGIDGTAGKGSVCALGLEEKVLARTVTFGKALGCHGAAILGNALIREVLINSARGFIYSTALPEASLIEIERAYQALPALELRRERLRHNIRLYQGDLGDGRDRSFLSPIHKVIVPGNEQVQRIARELKSRGFEVVAIRSPTVAAGSERIRICFHSYNTDNEILSLKNSLIELAIGQQEGAACGR